MMQMHGLPCEYCSFLCVKLSGGGRIKRGLGLYALLYKPNQNIRHVPRYQLSSTQPFHQLAAVYLSYQTTCNAPFAPSTRPWISTRNTFRQNGTETRLIRGTSKGLSIDQSGYLSTHYSWAATLIMLSTTVHGYLHLTLHDGLQASHPDQRRLQITSHMTPKLFIDRIIETEFPELFSASGIIVDIYNPHCNRRSLLNNPYHIIATGHECRQWPEKNASEF